MLQHLHITRSKMGKITASETIISLNKDHIKQRLAKYKKEKGLHYIPVVVAKNTGRAIKNFFTKYLPLKMAYSRSCEGKTIKKIQGNYMFLDLNDVGISRELVLTGVHEAASTAQTKKELKSGMRVLEVGANIGYYAMMEAKIVGTKGHIYAFEPSPPNFATLKANVLLNNLESQFTLYNKAAGSKIGKAKFYISNLGNLSSFIKRVDKSHIKDVDYIYVDVVKLDDFIKENPIDYLRMDVEGFELEVLKGMEETFKSGKGPKKLFIEVHSELLHKIDSSAEKLLLQMQAYDYDVSKAFFRGNPKVSVKSMKQLLKHKLREEGYWETFFVKLK